MPLVSIIIPTYNAGNCIYDCIKSILSQEYEYFEILVMDAISNDQTLDLIHQFNDSRIKVFSEADDGIYDAMNKGIRNAKGAWLYFLGSDDILYDNKVLTDLCEELKDARDVVYGNVLFKISKKVYDGKFTSLKLMEKNICHQSIIFNRKVFDKIGLYTLKYKYLADYDHSIKWFNSTLINKRYINRIIAVYNEGGSSFSNNDEAFGRDKHFLYSKSFSFFSRFLFKRKKWLNILVYYFFRYKNNRQNGLSA